MSSNEELIKLQGELSNKNKRISDNAKYVLGKNPPILNRAPIKEPDHRIPITFAKMTVDDMCGYAGKTGNIKMIYDIVSTESKEDDDPFIEYMREMDKYNDSELEISELYHEILEQGDAYEIFWTSDEKDLPGGLLTTEFKIVENDEIVCVFSSDLKKKMIKAVHFTKDDEMEEATVYYPFLNEYWQKVKGSEAWNLVNAEETPFSIVPVNKYVANRRELSIFSCEKHMIDKIDETISKTFNELERFASAILLIGKKMTKELVDALKENKVTVLDDLGEDGDGKLIMPQYLEKNLSGVKDFANEFIDQMEQWYRDSTKTINVADEKFGVAEAGIALMLKLLPMEFRASQIETYFNQGLMRRLKYYADVYNASTKSIDVNDYTTIIKSKRNVPVDDAKIVEMLAKLQGLVSKVALIEAMPKSIIEDTDKELQRLEDQMIDVSDNPITGDSDGVLPVPIAENKVALNVAQIAAARGIAEAVTAGQLPRAEGVELIVAMGVPREQAEKMIPKTVNLISGTEKVKPVAGK